MIELIAPGSPVEKVLAEIWSEVLEITPVGVNRDFFALGGHSLSATKVASRIKRRMGVEVPLRALFQNPTIAELARALPAVGSDLAAEHSPERARSDATIARARSDANIERGERTPDQSGSCRFPVSSAQRRMWFLDRLEGGDSRFYNIPWALRLDGPLDTERLEQAFRALVARHESLRTIFADAKGEPQQVVTPAAPLQLTVLDLAQLSEEARAVAVDQFLAGESNHRFDLRAGPLWRVRLLRLGHQQHLLVGNIHHIVVDGWSLDIIVSELAAFYNGKAEKLAQPPLQYADYTRWHNAWLSGPEPAVQMAYWKERLRGAPALLALPTDRPRPAIQTFRGAQHRFGLADPLAARIIELSREHGTTPYMTLLAAFQVLLHRYTGQDDIVVGSPVANRTRIETEGTVGVFINPLALRVELGDDPTYSELLRRVRQITLDAQAHQELPFEILLDELDVPRNTSHAPVFQVLFTMHGDRIDRPVFDGLQVEQVPVPSHTALVDLALSMTGDEHGLDGFLEYNTDLFAPETAARVIEHFRVLLEGIADDPTRPISGYSLMTREEAGSLSATWSQTSEPHHDLRPVHRMIAAAARRSPGNPAIVGAEEITYAELMRRIDDLSDRLRVLGAASGVLIAVCLPRSVDLVVAILAVLETGAAFLPMSPGLPRGRKRYIAEDAGVNLAITDAGSASQLRGAVAQIIDPETAWPGDRRWPRGQKRQHEPRQGRRYRPGFWLGRPRLCHLHIGFDGPAQGGAHQPSSAGQPLPWRDRSLCHRAGGPGPAVRVRGFRCDPRRDLPPPWLQAPALVLRPDASASLATGPGSDAVSLAEFTGWVVEQRISILNLPAAFWHEWVDELERKHAPSMPALRLMVTGSDCVSTDKLATWRRLYGDTIRWLNGYGPTEGHHQRELLRAPGRATEHRGGTHWHSSGQPALLYRGFTRSPGSPWAFPASCASVATAWRWAT